MHISIYQKNISIHIYIYIYAQREGERQIMFYVFFYLQRRIARRMVWPAPSGCVECRHNPFEVLVHHFCSGLGIYKVSTAGLPAIHQYDQRFLFATCCVFRSQGFTLHAFDPANYKCEIKQTELMVEQSCQACCLYICRACSYLNLWHAQHVFQFGTLGVCVSMRTVPECGQRRPAGSG